MALPSPAYQITMSLFFLPNRVQILFGNKVLRERKSLPQTQGMNPIGLSQARNPLYFVVFGLWVCMWPGSSQWESKGQSARGLLGKICLLRHEGDHQGEASAHLLYFLRWILSYEGEKLKAVAAIWAHERKTFLYTSLGRHMHLFCWASSH